jgi:hypothetical protein
MNYTPVMVEMSIPFADFSLFLFSFVAGRPD